MKDTPIRLPRWPAARLRIFDIMPDGNGAPYVGAPVTLLCRDGFVEDGGVTWLPDTELRRGHLEEVLDEQGQPVLNVTDGVFRGLMPIERPIPTVFAAFHMSFLRALLGGPHDRPPYDVCLHRALQQNIAWLRPCGLHEAAIECAPDRIAELTRDDDFLRLRCAMVVLETLLASVPLARLIVQSSAVVTPPPDNEPWGGSQAWQHMAPGPVYLEE